jgi:HEAT repeat protein
MKTRGALGLLPLLFGLWFFGTLAPYGVHVGEDGDLLYQMFATYRGQVPYIDFSSGYTPGFFYYHAALFWLFGVDALVTRISVAVANTLSLYLLYVLAARLVKPGLAVLAPLLFIGSLLAFPGDFCTFNVPYPAWYNIALWLGSLAAVAAYVDHGRMRALLVAGVLAGASFSVKPNIGLFNVAALSFFLLWWHSPAAGEGKATRWAWWTLAGVTAFGVIEVFRLQFFAREFRLFPLPLLLTAAVLLINARRSGGRSGFLRAGTMLMGGFALVTAPWLVYFLFRLGLKRFMADVLMVGSPYEFFFFIPHRLLGGRWDDGVLLIAVGLALVPAAVQRGWMPRWLPFLGGAMAAGAVALYVLFRAPMPEGFQAAVASRIHDLAFFLLHAVNWAGIGIIARETTRDPNRRSRFLSTLVLVGISAPAMVLGLYPRSDFMHLLISAPAALILGTALLGRVLRRWRAVLPDTVLWRWAAGALLATPPALIACVMAAPAVGLAVTLSGRYLGLGDGELVHLNLPRASLLAEPKNEHRFRELHAAARYLEQHTRPEEFVFPFPNLNLLCFLSGRLNPARKGYFNPGFPDHATEADIVTSLQKRVPRLVVSLHAHELFITMAPMYYLLIRDFVLTNFEPVARFGSYAILAPRHGPAGAEAIADTALDSSDGGWQGLNDPSPVVQLDAALRIRTARDPAGAAALAQRALRNDSPYRILFLRIVGEFGDERAVPALADIANDEYFSDAGQTAATALFNIAGKAILENYWFTPEVQQRRLELVGPQLRPEVFREWLRDPDLDVRLQYVAAWAAGVTGDRSAIPYLRTFVTSDNIGLNMVGVYALMRLGQVQKTAAGVVKFMRDDDTYMPSILIDLYRRDPDTVRPLIAHALRHGSGKQREMLAWVAAVLRDPAFMPILERQCFDGYEPIRKAAAWSVETLRRGGLVLARQPGP